MRTPVFQRGIQRQDQIGLQRSFIKVVRESNLEAGFSHVVPELVRSGSREDRIGCKIEQHFVLAGSQTIVQRLE